MVFGVAYDADEFVEEITKKDKGKERTNKGRRNSFEDIPTSKTYRSRSKKGLINTVSDNTTMQN